ncbi:MAG TPA: DUF72 domain-containing protein [Ktedonobacterales bacterium]|nr:DUF72 domain-containing protein [Ktedonobacterales bacterium]
MAKAQIRVGTASWTDHEPFYPSEYNKASMKSQRIAYYARYFNMVEVDSTFYRLQPTRNFELWAERTPPDFVFDVKAYGELTWHHRDEQNEPIPPSAETFAKFGEMIQPLRVAGKMGAILFQFPPWYKPTEEHMEYFAAMRELLPQDTIAVEFRQRAWLEGRQLDETRAILKDHDLAFCAVDEPQLGSGSVPPVTMITDPQFSMVRFHGRNAKMWYGKNLQSSRDRFDYLYTADELLPWAERIERIAEEMGRGQIHVVTNNNARNYSIVNALQLQDLLGQPVGKGEPLPENVDPHMIVESVSEAVRAAGKSQPKARTNKDASHAQQQMPGMS